MSELSDLQVLALDCQASSSHPTKGHLLELGWAAATDGRVVSELVKPPEDVAIPDRVLRVTGLSPEELSRGLEPEEVWRRIASAAEEVAAAGGGGACPTVVHFASYEERYLRWLHFQVDPEAPFRFRFVCTHRIARRLLPELPRKSLRAVAGYFGLGLSESRRAADHVRATLAVWRCLVALLAEREGVDALGALFEWLRAPGRPPLGTTRRYPMAPERWRGLPDRPGVYRMLRENGDVLYVGKAASLRGRVASYFRPGADHAGHTLEMLSQARDLSAVETATALEAALLESDEIKRIEPPYNRALRRGARSLLFAAQDLASFAERPDAAHRVGPLPASESLAAVARIAERLSGTKSVSAEAALAIPERYAPEAASFRAGLELFRRELGGTALLAFGARLWRREPEPDDEGEEELRLEAERETWRRPGPEEVAARLNEIVRRASQLVRRAHWHCLVSESTLSWRSRDGGRTALVLERGRVVARKTLGDAETPPPPPGGARSFAERRAGLELESYDRLTVLTKEMRRLLAEGRDPTLRLGAGVGLDAAALGRLLRWI